MDVDKCKHEWGDIDSVYDDIADGTRVLWTTCKKCNRAGMIKVQITDVEWVEGQQASGERK